MGKKKTSAFPLFFTLLAPNSDPATHICPHRDHRRQDRVSRGASTREELPVFGFVLSLSFSGGIVSGVDDFFSFSPPLIQALVGQLNPRSRSRLLVPVRVSCDRGKRGAAARGRRGRAGSDSAASGDDDDVGRRKGEARAARSSSPRRRRQRGRRAAREQGSHCCGRRWGGERKRRAKRGEEEGERKSDQPLLFAWRLCFFCVGDFVFFLFFFNPLAAKHSTPRHTQRETSRQRNTKHTLGIETKLKQVTKILIHKRKKEEQVLSKKNSKRQNRKNTSLPHSSPLFTRARRP